jgi:GT2 family glycosyltransferase
MTPPVPLSVVIATLDRPDRLARALTALADGELLPDQVIVVDQSGGPETRDVVQARRDRLPLRYVHSPRRGLAYNRNMAIRYATSPYLAFTDDDCVADRRWLKVVAQSFAVTDPPAALTGRVLPLGPSRPGVVAVSTRDSIREATFSGRTRPWEAGTGGNMAVSVDWLRRLGGFDERLGAGAPLRAGEDIDLLYRLLAGGARVRYEPAAVVYHERQARRRRIASRYSYGLGMGAFLGFRIRERDTYAWRLLLDWLALRCWAAAGTVHRAEWSRLREEALFLGGTVAGLARGLMSGDLTGGRDRPGPSHRPPSGTNLGAPGGCG